jgi:hypothetical protein
MHKYSRLLSKDRRQSRWVLLRAEIVFNPTIVFAVLELKYRAQEYLY